MKKINFKKYVSVKNTIFISLLLVTIFLFGSSASASWEHGIVGGIIGLFISGITKILILLVNALIVVASYSDFIHAEAVTKGWVVVRDVCNMFFVVVLLVIAFATILGQEEYSAKKNLPKLIMAAVLINFSKLFCGLMIDVANVVMLTFVNAFKEIGSGNIIDMLGISDILRYGSGGTAPSLSSTVSAYIFGLIYVLIATVVIASMLAMLVMRIVMMWVYIVLSPAAFFLQAVPGKGQQYASQWWSKWSSNLIVGPVLAFFLWLSFAALQTGNSPIPVPSNDQNAQETAAYAVNEAPTSTESIDSKAGSVAGFTKFIIAIGMLLGGMKVAQEVGGETGAALGKGMGVINKGKALAIGGATGAAVWAAKGAGRGTRNATLFGAGKLMNIGSGSDAVTGKQKGRAFGNLALQWRDDLVKGRKKEKAASREKFLKKIGISEESAAIGTEALNGVKTQYTGNISRDALKGAALGSFIPGVGTAAGATIGGLFGAARGVFGKVRLDKTKQDITNYEKGDKSTDDGHISTYRTALANDEKAKPNDVQKEAIKRHRKYNNQKALVSGGKEDFTNSLLTGLVSNGQSFEVTKGAFKNMTGKKKAAEDWVKVRSNDDNYLKSVGKGGIYDVNGINDVWKRRLDELNKGGDPSDKAIDKLETQILNSPSSPKDDAKLEEFAKLIAAYEMGGSTVNSGTLGKIKSALQTRNFDPAAQAGKVLTNYKGVGANRVEAGSGKLQYDAFAKNSAKMATDRNASKDIMGVSFAKLNDKMPANFKLDTAAGVNQKVEGAKLQELSKAMSGVIDDEIASLQTVGSEASKNSIAQLNVAKSRLASGDLSGLSLKNTDVKYDGATDSERRRNEYNTVQHENMHQAGAKNEDLVDTSSNILQNAKLVGRIPGAEGQRYDQEIGKLISAMEKNNASPEAIGEAVASQIDKWQPTSNAQRVLETESGDRDNVISEIAQPVEIKTEEIEKAIGKLSSSLDKTMMTSPSGKVIQLTPIDKDFFRGLFRRANKINSTVVEKLKPLGAMAAAEEKKKAA